MMGSSLDELTRALYARKKPIYKEPENALLKCPKCPNRLRPLLLDIYEENDITYQKIWWTCRSLKTKKCIFPLMMPPEVFWTKRTEEQMRQDVIPLPNFNLLPKEYWKLYPTLFKPKKNQQVKKDDGLDEDVIDITPESTENIDKQKFNDKNDEDLVILENDLSVKKREASKKQKKRRKPKNENECSPISRRMVGVTITPQAANKVDLEALRKPLPLPPAEERIVAGGRNFDIKMIDEITMKSNGKTSFVDNVYDSLKTALAMRFAKAEVLDRITGCVTENFQRSDSNSAEQRKMLKRISEQVKLDSTPIFGGSQSSGSEIDVKYFNQLNNEDPTTKTIQSYRQMELASKISQRLGIKVEEFDPLAPKKPRLSNVSSTNELFSRIKTSSSTATNPSASTPSPSCETNSESRYDMTTQEFTSPELNSLVRRHLQTLKTKVNKKRRKSKKRENETVQQNNAIQSFDNHSNYGTMHHDIDLEPVLDPDFANDFDFGNYDVFGY